MMEIFSNLYSFSADFARDHPKTSALAVTFIAFWCIIFPLYSSAPENSSGSRLQDRTVPTANVMNTIAASFKSYSQTEAAEALTISGEAKKRTIPAETSTPQPKTTATKTPTPSSTPLPTSVPTPDIHQQTPWLEIKSFFPPVFVFPRGQ